MQCRPLWNRWSSLAVIPSMATRQKNFTLKVFGLNCSLKSSKSRERSSTDALMQQLFGELAKQGATGKIVRAADYNNKPASNLTRAKATTGRPFAGNWLLPTFSSSARRSGSASPRASYMRTLHPHQALALTLLWHEACAGLVDVLRIVDPVVTREIVIGVNPRRPTTVALELVRKVVQAQIKNLVLTPDMATKPMIRAAE
jgi:hypothetical protein